MTEGSGFQKSKTTREKQARYLRMREIIILKEGILHSAISFREMWHRVPRKSGVMLVLAWALQNRQCFLIMLRRLTVTEKSSAASMGWKILLPKRYSIME